MVKIAVLGAGLMGKEIVRDLISGDLVTKVYLADVQETKAQAVKEALQAELIEAVQLDVTNDEALKQMMGQVDVVINALFYTFNVRVAKMAIEVGVHLVDLGGHIGGATEQVLQLNNEAKSKGITIIPDLGLAPGMTNILAGYGASKLDEVHGIKIYVGGIPAQKEGPLAYNVVFSLDGVFDHYTDPSEVIRDGVRRKVPSLTDIEPVYFAGYSGLEAFHTSGGLSTLVETFNNIRSLEYKTIRYAGHAEKFKLLVDLGLTKKESVANLNGQEVHVREVLKAYLQETLDLGDKTDVVLLRVVVTGEEVEERASLEYEMVATRNKENKVTAMATATAATISVVAQLIADGTISLHGVIPPEKAVPGDIYIEKMQNRSVTISETKLRSTNIIKG